MVKWRVAQTPLLGGSCCCNYTKIPQELKEWTGVRRVSRAPLARSHRSHPLPLWGARQHGEQPRWQRASNTHFNYGVTPTGGERATRATAQIRRSPQSPSGGPFIIPASTHGDKKCCVYRSLSRVFLSVFMVDEDVFSLTCCAMNVRKVNLLRGANKSLKQIKLPGRRLCVSAPWIAPALCGPRGKGNVRLFTEH